MPRSFEKKEHIISYPFPPQQHTKIAAWPQNHGISSNPMVFLRKRFCHEYIVMCIYVHLARIHSVAWWKSSTTNPHTWTHYNYNPLPSFRGFHSLLRFRWWLPSPPVPTNQSPYPRYCRLLRLQPLLSNTYALHWKGLFLEKTLFHVLLGFGILIQHDIANINTKNIDKHNWSLVPKKLRALIILRRCGNSPISSVWKEKVM